MSLVSVIVPVYNGIETIERTIECIQNQTYRNWELILIDDGSTDGTGEVCEKKAVHDSRIKVQRNSNQGVAQSRNQGLLLAQGEYIVFLDADDVFERNMLEDAVNGLEEIGADVCVWGYITHNLISDDISKHEMRDECVEKKNMTFETIRQASWAPWNKMVRRDMLFKKNITFQDIPNANDVFYACAILLEAEKVLFINKNNLEYFEGKKGSITQERISKRDYTVWANAKVIEYMIERNIAESIRCAYVNYALDVLAKVFLDGSMTDECKNIFCMDWKESQIYGLCKEQWNLLNGHQRRFVEKMNCASRELMNATYYELFDEYLTKVMDKAEKTHKEVAIWGFGRMGKLFIDYLTARKKKIDYIIDSDSKKWGQIYKGYEVVSYERLSDRSLIIIVLNSLYYEEIRKKIKPSKIINLELE